MKLRKKLLSTFGGLAVLALLNAGVTGWAIVKWETSNRELNNHYQRSLLVKELKMRVINASQTIREAISTGESPARRKFSADIAPVEGYFQNWSKLAHNQSEDQQIKELKKAYGSLLQDAEHILQLLGAGRTFEALKLRNDQLQSSSLQRFEKLADQAINSDQKYRQEILQLVKQSQETAELVLILAAFGTISLSLLLFAYLNSDLFTPLQEVKQALDQLSQGDRRINLDIERADEIGSVNRAFNRLVQSLKKREQIFNLTALSTNNQGSIENAPSRLLIHQLLNQIEVQLSQLDLINSNGKTDKKQEIFSQVTQLLHTVTHLTEFGFPLDLNLTKIDIRALLYEIVVSFQEELVSRSISIELEIAPEIKRAVVDRLKLREVLKQLIDNALEALPETGGRIGLFAYLANRSELLIEVTDNGTGIKQSLLNRIFDEEEILFDENPLSPSPMGLKLTKAIVEQHGGELKLNSELNQGTQVQIRLPLLG